MPSRGLRFRVKIVTCYTPGALREETEQAMLACLDTHDYRDVNWRRVCLSAHDPRAYGREIAARWYGQGLAIVEPDIVVRPDVLDAFVNCPEPYCAFPYDLSTDVMCALGCTRFSADFIARYPSLMREAVGENVSWFQFDIVVQRKLLVDRYGEQPHVHLPKVEHLNELKALRPDANPEPLMSIPGMTFQLQPETA